MHVTCLENVSFRMKQKYERRVQSSASGQTMYTMYTYTYMVYIYIYMVYTLRLRYLLFCVYYCTCSNISNSSFSLTPCRNSPGFPFPDLAFSSWLATRGRLQSFQWLDSPGGATKRERETDRPKLKPQITVHPTKMVENSW